MKWVYILVVVFLVFVAVKLYPMVMKEKACFDTAAQTIDTLNFSMVANNVSKKDMCSIRSGYLLNLDDCLTQAKAGNKFAKYTGSLVEDAVYVIRPLTKSYITQRNEHNTECSDYPEFQLE